MQHIDTKDEGKKVCDDLRDFVQTELSKLPEQHRNSFPLPKDSMTGSAGKNVKNCVQKPARQQLKKKTTSQKN